jgi:hypothetical protein
LSSLGAPFWRRTTSWRRSVGSETDRAGDDQLGHGAGLDESEDGLEAVLGVVGRLDLEGQSSSTGVAQLVRGGTAGGGDRGLGGFDREGHLEMNLEEERREEMRESGAGDEQ